MEEGKHMWWYLIVKNKSTQWCQLRHIIRCEVGTDIQEAIDDYYRLFRKLDGDVFYMAKSHEEMEAVVDREE